MSMRDGEQYVCGNPSCGCEIEVTKGAAPGSGGKHLPRCCCGEEMSLGASSRFDARAERKAPAGAN